MEMVDIETKPLGNLNKTSLGLSQGRRSNFNLFFTPYSTKFV